MTQKDLEVMQFANNAFACFWFNYLKIEFYLLQGKWLTYHISRIISEKFSLPSFLPPDKISIAFYPLHPLF